MPAWVTAVVAILFVYLQIWLFKDYELLRRGPWRAPVLWPSTCALVSIIAFAAMRRVRRQRYTFSMAERRAGAAAATERPHGYPTREMDDDRTTIEYHAGKAAPLPFRPGLRALTAVAFAGAVYFSLFTLVILRKLPLRVWETWTLYAAIALALLGVLFFRLAYRSPRGGAR